MLQEEEKRKKGGGREEKEKRRERKGWRKDKRREIAEDGSDVTVNRGYYPPIINIGTVICLRWMERWM